MGAEESAFVDIKNFFEFLWREILYFASEKKKKDSNEFEGDGNGKYWSENGRKFQ